MKNRNLSLTADIGYIFLLILLFINTAFLVFRENTSYNMVALCIVFAFMLLTYFTSITLGLILNIVILFAGFSWYLYRMISYGEAIQQEFFYWAVMSPLLTFVSYSAFRSMGLMEEENHTLKERVKHFSIIDDVTELKNLQAYDMEFAIYQKIAERYDIGLMLIIWQFRYAEELSKILGKRGMEQTAVKLSKAMGEVLRKEDVVYILSKNPYEWGSLLLSKEDSRDMLKGRLKENISNLDFREILGKNAPKMEVRVGVYFTREAEETAKSMLEKAKDTLQYDV